VACASIVAKVTRDRVMRALGSRHPEYHWSHNVGYATAAHLAGIRDHGISPHHRRRWWRVAQLTLALDGAPDEEPLALEATLLRDLEAQSVLVVADGAASGG
jgi:ribonuclease HII